MVDRVAETKESESGHEQRDVVEVLRGEAGRQGDPVARHHGRVHFERANGEHVGVAGQKSQEEWETLKKEGARKQEGGESIGGIGGRL